MNPTLTQTLTQTLNVAKQFYKSCIHMYTVSKQIELESPDWSRFEENSKDFPTVLYFLTF